MGDQLDERGEDRDQRRDQGGPRLLESDDAEEIKAKTDALQAAFHKVSEQIYQAGRRAAGAADGDGVGATARGEAEDEVVDAEVVDDERS